MHRVAITGMGGFLGWHIACRLRAVYGIEPVGVGRGLMGDPSSFAATLEEVDAVIHVAGVNRADTAAAVQQGNVAAARQLARGLERIGRPLPVSYANSIQQDADTPYGRGKAQAAVVLREANHALGGRFANVVLPNLFGEHGRPDYNSFVATFTRNIVDGAQPVIREDRTVPLLHVQDAADALIRGLESEVEVRPAGEVHCVSEIADRLARIHGLYRRGGEVPPLLNAFDVNLFNTYRAAAWPSMFPIRPPLHEDQRGQLFETVRSHGGQGQAFISSTKPGMTRGEHYHLHKVERFAVLRGEAEISLRRLFSADLVRFRLRGDEPAFVDMPTLWVHNLRNIGDSELVTLFWSNQLLDPNNSDQYPEKVCP